VNFLGRLLEKLKKPEEERELEQANACSIDVDSEVERGAKMIQEVYEDDEAHRVQAIMLGEEHDPVLESEKQAAAATFQLGPRKTPP
jgi:hypothetical protein